MVEAILPFQYTSSWKIFRTLPEVRNKWSYTSILQRFHGLHKEPLILLCFSQFFNKNSVKVYNLTRVNVISRSEQLKQ